MSSPLKDVVTLPKLMATGKSPAAVAEWLGITVPEVWARAQTAGLAEIWAGDPEYSKYAIEVPPKVSRSRKRTTALDDWFSDSDAAKTPAPVVTKMEIPVIEQALITEDTEVPSNGKAAHEEPVTVTEVKAGGRRGRPKGSKNKETTAERMQAASAVHVSTSGVVTRRRSAPAKVAAPRGRQLKTVEHAPNADNAREYRYSLIGRLYELASSNGMSVEALKDMVLEAFGKPV